MSTFVPTRASVRTLAVAVRALLVFTVVAGIVYPALVLAIGHLAFPAQANGSLVRDDHGTVAGSRLIGQSFTAPDGAALPSWFQSRPSAAGGDGYDGGASGGSNLGPQNPALVAAISARRAAVAAQNHVSPEAVPADAVTASGSGLDPDISVAYARLQVARVAAARHLPASAVEQLVDRHVADRMLGYIGEPTVNVLALNRGLEQLTDARAGIGQKAGN